MFLTDLFCTAYQLKVLAFLVICREKRSRVANSHGHNIPKATGQFISYIFLCLAVLLNLYYSTSVLERPFDLFTNACMKRKDVS